MHFKIYIVLSLLTFCLGGCQQNILDKDLHHSRTIERDLTKPLKASITQKLDQLVPVLVVDYMDGASERLAGPLTVSTTVTTCPWLVLNSHVFGDNVSDPAALALERTQLLIHELTQQGIKQARIIPLVSWGHEQQTFSLDNTIRGYCLENSNQLSAVPLFTHTKKPIRMSP